MNFGPSAGIKKQSDIADLSRPRQIRNMVVLLVGRYASCHCILRECYFRRCRFPDIAILTECPLCAAILLKKSASWLFARA